MGTLLLGSLLLLNLVLLALVAGIFRRLSRASQAAEITELARALIGQGLDLRDANAGLDAGSRDQLYWKYGYFRGLKRALAMFTDGSATPR